MESLTWAKGSHHKGPSGKATSHRLLSCGNSEQPWVPPSASMCLHFPTLGHSLEARASHKALLWWKARARWGSGRCAHLGQESPLVLQTRGTNAIDPSRWWSELHGRSSFPRAYSALSRAASSLLTLGQPGSSSRAAECGAEGRVSAVNHVDTASQPGRPCLI